MLKTEVLNAVGDFPSVVETGDQAMRDLQLFSHAWFYAAKAGAFLMLGKKKAGKALLLRAIAALESFEWPY